MIRKVIVLLIYTNPMIQAESMITNTGTKFRTNKQSIYSALRSYSSSAFIRVKNKERKMKN